MSLTSHLHGALADVVYFAFCMSIFFFYFVNIEREKVLEGANELFIIFQLKGACVKLKMAENKDDEKRYYGYLFRLNGKVTNFKRGLISNCKKDVGKSALSTTLLPHRTHTSLCRHLAKY